LLKAPDVGTIRGKRSHAFLTLGLTCGLRRSELAQLSIDRLQRREDHWPLLTWSEKADTFEPFRGQRGPGRLDHGGGSRERPNLSVCEQERIGSGKGITEKVVLEAV
jgi:hypothetical protein